MSATEFRLATPHLSTFYMTLWPFPPFKQWYIHHGHFFGHHRLIHHNFTLNAIFITSSATIIPNILLLWHNHFTNNALTPPSPSSLQQRCCCQHGLICCRNYHYPSNDPPPTPPYPQCHHHHQKCTTLSVPYFSYPYHSCCSNHSHTTTLYSWQKLLLLLPSFTNMIFLPDTITVHCCVYAISPHFLSAILSPRPFMPAVTIPILLSTPIHWNHTKTLCQIPPPLIPIYITPCHH